MLKTGQRAPLFSLPDSDMVRVDLARYRGRKNVVLYFYPRDGTPACTLQATNFSDHEDEFARHDCVVLGISPDDCLCHAEFRDANGVSIVLLADTECEVCEKYGVLQAGDDAADVAPGNGSGGHGETPNGMAVAAMEGMAAAVALAVARLHATSPAPHSSSTSAAWCAMRSTMSARVAMPCRFSIS